MYTNAGSAGNKWEELFAVAIGADIIAVTETWLREEATMPQSCPPHYRVYRTDRNDGRNGGGALILVSESFVQMEAEGMNTPNIQVVACSLFARGIKVEVACVYRSPAASGEEDEQLMEYVRRCMQKERPLIMGDFNAPDVDWERGTARGRLFGHELLRAVQDGAMVQHVKVPTRMREGQEPSVLDLVITKFNRDVQGMEIVAPLGSSDHVVLKMTTEFEAPAVPDKYRRNFRQLNKGLLEEQARSLDWIPQEGGVEERWRKIKENLIQLMESHAPFKRIRRRGKPPWWRSRAQKAQREKSRAWGRYKATGGHTRLLQYKRARTKAKQVQRDCRRKYEERLASRAKENPKAYYNYAQSKARLRKAVGNVKREDGGLAVSPEEKASTLAGWFERVHRTDAGLNPTTVSPGEISIPMPEVEISREEVEGQLGKLVLGKAAGPDGLHAEIIKPLATVLCEPVAMLFSQCLREGCLPEDWKRSQVVPIHKGGPVEEPANYRPVSLTSVILKVLERIIRDRIVEHLTGNNLLSAAQHGFRRNKSCLTNLLCFLDEVTDRMDRGEDVEVCYLDFQKAFDSVCHRLLLRKLEIYGIEVRIRNWIREFLTDRTFYVEVEGRRSGQMRAVSGVPQGSVLGPLLFLVYIDNLVENLKCPYYMFADDVKVVGEPGQQDIQEDLDTIVRWTQEWDLPLNLTKCTRLVCARGEVRERWLASGQSRTELMRVEKAKDLGIYVTQDLKPRKQCETAARRARWALHELRRAVRSRSPKVLLPLYKAYVRPHLEYAVQAWSPSRVGDKKLLEGVQKSFTRMFPGLRELGYEERLSRLNLFSLGRRRKRGDLIETFKQMKGFSEPGKALFLRATTVDLRGHPLKLAKPRARARTRSDFYSHRVVNDWNRLPNEVVESISVTQFKRRLDDCWETIFPEVR